MHPYIKTSTMQETLKSTLLEFEKSSTYINFIKPFSGENYIAVEQTMVNNNITQKIKINISDLPQIISSLQMYQKELSDPDSDICKNFLSKEKQQSVVKRCLKGISIPDLALQFNCTIETISSILSRNEIEMENEKALKRIQMIERSKRKY
jgi:hypothetical protein